MLWLLSLLLFQLAQAQCPSGFTYWSISNKCYKFVQIEASYQDAEQQCGPMLGGHLASIHNAFENTFINQNMAGPHYENVTIITPMNYWIGLNYLNELELGWTDNSAVDYLNWAANQPTSPSATMCSYMLVHDAMWGTDLCHKKRHYICEVAPFGGPATTIAVPASTPAPTSATLGMMFDIVFLLDVAKSAANTYDDMAQFVTTLMSVYDVGYFNNVHVGLVPVMGSDVQTDLAYAQLNAVTSNQQLAAYLQYMKTDMGDFEDNGQNLQAALNVAAGSSFAVQSRGYRPFLNNHLLVYVTSTSDFTDNPSTASILQGNTYGIITVGYGSGVTNGAALQAISGGAGCYYYASSFTDLIGTVVQKVRSQIAAADQNGGHYCGN